MAIFYVDGNYVEEQQAALPLTDMAILRGYAVFDYLRTYNGKPFHLDDHILRLHRSANLLQLHFPWQVAEIKEIVSELLEKNGFAETNLRFIVTGGDSEDSITPANKTRLIIMATELKPFPQEWYSQGVKIISTKVTRYIPGAKSTNYIKAIMALRNAHRSGAIESIYVNESGQLLEGTTSNLFAVRRGRIITPADDILPGITRQVVLKLAEQNDIPVQQAPIRLSEVEEYSEVFITSSNKEVVPVSYLDTLKIAENPGSVTQKIMTIFRHCTDNWV